MILLELRIKAPPDARESVQKELQRRMGFALTQRGCLTSRCLLEAGDSLSFTLMEEWESRDHLDRHARSEDFRILLSLLDLSEERPNFRIHAVSGTAGLGTLPGRRA